MAESFVIKTRLSLRDRIIAASLGVAFVVAEWAFGVNGIDPSQWNEIAIVAGLRPPQAIFPGLWRLLTGCAFSVFGLNATLGALTWLGALTGAGSVMLVYLVTHDALGWLLRTDPSPSAWTRALTPFFSAVAAVFFGLSTPLWEMSQTFSPEGLRFFLLLLSAHVWLRWFSCGGNARLFLAVGLVGLLMAESPFALFVLVFFLVWYFCLWQRIEDGGYAAPAHLPTPSDLPYWRMFFIFFGVMGLTVFANVTYFSAKGGLAANGFGMGDVYFRYFGGYLRALVGSSTLAGWALGLGIGLFPAVVALRLFPLLTNETRPMSFGLGVMMLVVGCVAILQTGLVPSARFWMFVKDVEIVSSRPLLAFYAFASSLTVALFGACFAFECHRLYRMDGESVPGLLLRLLPPGLTLLIVLATLPRVAHPVARLAQRVVDDTLAETVAECGDAKWLFTDGHLDAGLEIAARSRGKELYPLNMMSSALPWEKALRTRSFPAGSDRDAAETGVPVLLRVWANEKENGMDKAAIQLGFEIWKRERKPLPKISGLVAREKGMDDAAAQRGIEASRKLSERILALGENVNRATASRALTEAFSAISWRLSRFARLRDDEKLADGLDASNGTIKKLLSIIEYERQRTFMQMTPREGLEIALKRADFAMARRYAASVLRGNDKNPEANFGTGMAFLRDGNMVEAEKYLRKVLEVRPDEPAVLNNLSIICRKAKRYEEAVGFARHALKMLPNSPEVKRTLADAEAKRP